MVDDRGKVAVGNECGTPELKDFVDEGLGEVCSEVKDVGQFKSCS